MRGRQEAQEEVNCFAVHSRRARNPKNREWWLKEWHYEQRIFDIMKDSFPARYQIKLENRSYKEGASRAGEALEEVVDDRKKAPAKRRFKDLYE